MNGIYRICKIAQELNVSILTILEFLRKNCNGVPEDSNPNYKVTQEQYQLLKNEFGKAESSNIEQYPKNEQTPSINLLNQLESIGKTIIADTPENSNFIVNPDDVNEHDPKWHQYGIITHSLAAYRAYKEEFETILENWGLYDFIQNKLKETVDGKSKNELLDFAIILHDIGKFQRSFKTLNGEKFPDYEGHEYKSERIILDKSKGFYDILVSDYHLNDNQINYIAKCAGLHYELGKIRKMAYEEGGGFSLSYIYSVSCANNFSELLLKHENFDVEIGIMFLCDNLAKTNIRIEAKSDEEIEKKSDKIISIVKKERLHPNLIKAVKQLPVSLHLVYKYFELLKVQ